MVVCGSVGSWSQVVVKICRGWWEEGGASNLSLYRVLVAEGGVGVGVGVGVGCCCCCCDTSLSRPNRGWVGVEGEYK